jgi:hypothetical protein
MILRWRDSNLRSPVRGSTLFETMFNRSGPPPTGPDHLLGSGLTLADDLPVFVDDSDGGLLERDIQTTEMLDETLR